MLFAVDPKCPTCRSARAWLDAHGFAYEERNIVEDSPSAGEIRRWQIAGGFSIGRFFDTESQLFLEMGLKSRAKVLSNFELLDLLGDNPLLLKHPILVDGDTVLVGFDERQWTERLL